MDEHCFKRVRQGRHSSNNVLHALKPDTKNLIRKNWDLAPGTKCGGTSFGVFRMSQGFQPSLFKKGTAHEPLRTTLAPSSLFRVGNIFIYVNTAYHKFHIPSMYSCGRLTRPMASAVDGWRFSVFELDLAGMYILCFQGKKLHMNGSFLVVRET